MVHIGANQSEVCRALQQFSDDLRQHLTAQNFMEVNVQWGKNHHRPAADQKESCRAPRRGVEGGVRRLYFGNDGAVYDAVDCQQRQ